MISRSKYKLAVRIVERLKFEDKTYKKIIDFLTLSTFNKADFIKIAVGPLAFFQCELALSLVKYGACIFSGKDRWSNSILCYYYLDTS